MLIDRVSSSFGAQSFGATPSDFPRSIAVLLDRPGVSIPRALRYGLVFLSAVKSRPYVSSLACVTTHWTINTTHWTIKENDFNDRNTRTALMRARSYTATVSCYPASFRPIWC